MNIARTLRDNASHQLWRSHTIGINVVQRSAATFVNVYVNGIAAASHELPGKVSLSEALLWYGTQLKLRGE